MGTQNLTGTIAGSGGLSGAFAFSAKQYTGLQSWLYGGVSYPLAQPSSNTLLQDADPAIFYALDFFSYCIRTYVGPRFTAVCAAAGVRGSDGNVVSTAVQTTLPYDPRPHGQDAQFALPLLAVYRKRGAGRRASVAKSNEWTDLEFLYVLPPLDASQAEVLEPVLHAVELLLENRLEQGFDAGYTPPGGLLGQQPWALAGIQQIEWVGCEYEKFDGGGNLAFPTLRAKVVVAERQGKYLGQPTFLGADVTLSVVGDATNQPLKVLEVDTWVPVPHS